MSRHPDHFGNVTFRGSVHKEHGRTPTQNGQTFITYLVTKPDGSEVVKLPRPHAERNAWLHEQFTTTTKTIEAIKREANGKGWHVGENSHFYQCLRNHCNDNGIPMPTRNNRTT
jgi:hypothetical protein